MRIVVIGVSLLLLLLSPEYALHAADASSQAAQNILRQVTSATAATKTLSATLTILSRTSQGDLSSSGPIYLRRPNLARIDVNYIRGNAFSTAASDGKTAWELTQDSQEGSAVIALGPIPPSYRIVPADPNGHNIHFPEALPVNYFFQPNLSPLSYELSDVKLDTASSPFYIGRQTVNGITCDVIERKVLQPMRIDERLYIGPSHLITRVEYRFPKTSRPDEVYYTDVSLSHVVVNQPINIARFDYQLPAGARPYTNLWSGKLLPVGSKAPDFALNLLHGGNPHLYDVLRTKKAVLLDFWFVSCTTCRHEFPVLQELYSQFDSQGLEVIGVDVGDPSHTVSGAFRTLDLLKNTTFPISQTGDGDKTHIADRYGVEGYPTSYLIDPSGTITFVSSGYDESAGLVNLNKALAAMGFNLDTINDAKHVVEH